jgi:hypothetical protein
MLAFVPDEPVAVGFRIEADSKLLKAMHGSEADNVSDVVITLLRTETVDGKPCGVFERTGITRIPMDVVSELVPAAERSTYWVTIAERAVIRYTFEMNIDQKFAEDGADIDIQAKLSGDGTSSYTPGPAPTN